MRKKIVTGVVATAILLFVSITLTACNSSNNTGSNGSSGKREYLALDEIGTVNNWEVEIHDVYFQSSVQIMRMFPGSYFSGQHAGTGNTWLVVHYSVTNQDNVPRRFGPTRIIHYGENRYTGSISGSANDIDSRVTQPLATSRGWISYRIPLVVATSEDGLIFEIARNQRNTNDRIFWRFTDIETKPTGFIYQF